MKSNYKEIWSTPIAEYYLDRIELHATIIETMNKRFNDIGNTLNVVDSMNTEFISWVYNCIYDYLNKFYNLQNKIIIQRGWIEKQDQFETNEAHSHAPVDLIAIYYIDPHPEHPELIVYDPRPPHRFNEVKIIKNGIIRADCARHITIKPEPYKLVVLPGYLLHGVGTNLSEHPRYSLAMNIKIER